VFAGCPILVCCGMRCVLLRVGVSSVELLTVHSRSKGLLTDLWVSFEGFFVWEGFGSFGVLTLKLGGMKVPSTFGIKDL
jgi:hypothetical protein